MERMQIIFGALLLLVLLFVPGYLLTLVLFPRKRSLDIVERIGLGFVFSLIPPVSLYALNKNLGIPINTVNSLVVVGAFVVACGILYTRKRETEEKPKK